MQTPKQVNVGSDQNQSEANCHEVEDRDYRIKEFGKTAHQFYGPITGPNKF